MAVKALTFDIIGTVFDWLDSFSTEVVPLAQEYALSIDPTTFANDALDGYSAGVKAVLDGAPWTPPDEILRDSITSLLSAAGPTPSAVEVDDFFALWRTLNPWADVPLALYALHDHFTLAILSNMSITTQSALMDHAGLPFDRTLSAETVQAYKPNPAVYQMAISSLGLLPDEIMMVAAHQYDLSAAQAQGMQTAFIARSSEPPPNAPNPAFDINVTTYGELVHELGADPPTLQEDCLRVQPHALRVRQLSGGWTVVDGSDLLLDFGPSRANADRAKDVIHFYGLDRICYVGRPNPPMMYFTTKSRAPAGPMPGEDAIAFDLARIRADQLAGDWIVTDGTSRLLDFGPSQFNALHAVAIIRNYGFTHQCFVGRPDAPMMYFRK